MHREHGHVGNRLLHDRGRAHAEQVRRVHRAHHADARRADAHVHEVDETGARQPRRDLGAVVGTEAVPVARFLVADEPHADRDRRTDRGAHRLEHLDREPHAIVERAAVLVGAEVVLGREELVDEVAVRGVHLDAVEAGVGRVPRAAARSARRPRGSRRARSASTPPCGSRCPTPTTPAAATRSRGSRRRCARAAGTRARRARWICSLTRRRCGTHAGSHTAALLCIWYAVVGCTCAWPGDDGADAAPRVLGEVAAVALAVEAGLAVRAARLGVHREVRAAHDAVARDDRAERERREQPRKAHAVRLARDTRGRDADGDPVSRRAQSASRPWPCPSACRRRLPRGPS